MNIRKIILEEIDDFDFVRETNPHIFRLVPERFEDYASGRLHLTSFMNIIMNDRSHDWLEELGKYTYQYYKQSGKNNHVLNFWMEGVEDTEGDDEYRIRRKYVSLGIWMMTAMEDRIMERMFGDAPIYHDEFGEGFDGEYDEELDEYGEPDIPESHASYMVEVNGRIFHIGWDHRGVGLAVEPNLTSEQLYRDILVPLVESYIDNA